MKKHLFYQMTASSFIAASLLLFPLHPSAVAQENNTNTIQENLDQAGENLRDATQQAGEIAEQQFAETADFVEERANWGWLGLLGLLGLFGLAGNRRERVVYYSETDPYRARTVPRDYRL